MPRVWRGFRFPGIDRWLVAGDATGGVVGADVVAPGSVPATGYVALTDWREIPACAQAGPRAAVGRATIESRASLKDFAVFVELFGRRRRADLGSFGQDCLFAAVALDQRALVGEGAFVDLVRVTDLS